MKFLPPINSKRYHTMLIIATVLLWGPLGAVAAAFMSFKLGFFVGGSLLAGLLGSIVVIPYKSAGRHGANFQQTMAASIAGMGGLVVLPQTLVWMGVAPPSNWLLGLFMGCCAMMGCGMGMLWTPILVDRMNLMFPTGVTVAYYIRAFSNFKLLAKAGRTMIAGFIPGVIGGLAALKVAAIEAINLSTSTIGAGMITGPRIAIPGLVMGLVGVALTPYLRSIGWISPEQEWRHAAFMIALGMLLAAGVVDLFLMGRDAANAYVAAKQGGAMAPSTPEERRLRRFLLIWVACWGMVVILISTLLLHLPLLYVVVAMAMAFIFVFVNGVSTGLTDWNSISMVFVIVVVALKGLGLSDPVTGLFCAAIPFIAVSVGVDMQQDRSTGKRLGTDRLPQFVYQVAGHLVAPVICLGLAWFFMSSYPELQIDQTSQGKVAGWQASMTLKLKGALDALTQKNGTSHATTALWIGLGIGFTTEILRRLLKSWRRYQLYCLGDEKMGIKPTKAGLAIDFIIDAVLLPSPYASSFGGFVTFMSTVWFAIGGVGRTIVNWIVKPIEVPEKAGETVQAEDRQITHASLLGGGLVLGEAIAALSIGFTGIMILLRNKK